MKQTHSWKIEVERFTSWNYIGRLGKTMSQICRIANFERFCLKSKLCRKNAPSSRFIFSLTLNGITQLQHLWNAMVSLSCTFIVSMLQSQEALIVVSTETEQWNSYSQHTYIQHKQFHNSSTLPSTNLLLLLPSTFHCSSKLLNMLEQIKIGKNEGTKNSNVIPKQVDTWQLGSYIFICHKNLEQIVEFVSKSSKAMWHPVHTARHLN